MSDWNAQIIEEFRANDGRVGGMFDGKPLLILHTTGAKTGQLREIPLMYQSLEGGYAVFASKGGAPGNPAWLHNLKANPGVKVELGIKTVAATARVADSYERQPIWERQVADYPQFGEYQENTDRTIPVVILDPN